MITRRLRTARPLLLERTLRDLAGQVSMAVAVGDLATENDAARLRQHGAQAEQIGRELATLSAAALGPNETELTIHTESSILGKLGEFGQAVMRKKADQIVEEFAKNMAKAINAG